MKNVTTSFVYASFTGLALKRSITTFTTKGGVYRFLSPVNPITNSSILNSQIIPTHYCYQLLLKMFTERINHTISGFGEGMEKGTVITPHPICSFPLPSTCFLIFLHHFFVVAGHNECLTPYLFYLSPPPNIYFPIQGVIYPLPPTLPPSLL